MGDGLRRIESVQNTTVKHWVKLRDEASYRNETKRVFVEGKKIVFEVLKRGGNVQIIVEEGLIFPEAIEKNQNNIVITPAISKKIASTPTSEGIFAELDLPLWSDLEDKRWIVVCDGVSDPGNLGTIIRTALALGWKGLFLLNPCCDPFNEKALRAAMGATFHLPMRKGTLEELENLVKKTSNPVLVADIVGKDVNGFQTTNGAFLILGNEAHGPSERVKEQFTPITIPMDNQSESLNVAIAGAILMYALKKSSPIV